MDGRRQVIISPQIYVSMDPRNLVDFGEETQPRRAEIPMVWMQDGDNFRLDIDLPHSSVLDVLFSPAVDSLHINGETIWENATAHAVRLTGVHVEVTPAGLRLTCTSSGAMHILARCMLDAAPAA